MNIFHKLQVIGCVLRRFGNAGFVQFFADERILNRAGTYCLR